MVLQDAGLRSNVPANGPELETCGWGNALLWPNVLWYGLTSGGTKAGFTLH